MIKQRLCINGYFDTQLSTKIGKEFKQAIKPLIANYIQSVDRADLEVILTHGLQMEMSLAQVLMDIEESKVKNGVLGVTPL